jgi:hypothetical protein
MAGRQGNLSGVGSFEIGSSSAFRRLGLGTDRSVRQSARGQRRKTTHFSRNTSTPGGVLQIQPEPKGGMKFWGKSDEIIDATTRSDTIEVAGRTVHFPNMVPSSLRYSSLAAARFYGPPSASANFTPG